MKITPDVIECLCIEILSKNSKNLILNLGYRPSQGDTLSFEKNLQDYLLRHDVCIKEVLITGDFQYKSSRFYKHWNKNSYHKGRYFWSLNADVNIKTEQYILKSNACDQSITKFKQKLRDVTCDDIKVFGSVNHSYNRFPHIFLSLYNECFPEKKIKVKPQKYFRQKQSSSAVL